MIFLGSSSLTTTFSKRSITCEFYALHHLSIFDPAFSIFLISFFDFYDLFCDTKRIEHDLTWKFPLIIIIMMRMNLKEKDEMSQQTKQ